LQGTRRGGVEQERFKKKGSGREAQKYLAFENRITSWLVQQFIHHHLASEVKACWCGGGGAENATLSICAQTGFLQPFLTFPASQREPGSAGLSKTSGNILQ